MALSIDLLRHKLVEALHGMDSPDTLQVCAACESFKAALDCCHDLGYDVTLTMKAAELAVEVRKPDEKKEPSPGDFVAS